MLTKRPRGRPISPEMEKRYRREAQFCLNHCPNADGECRGKIKRCMAEAVRRGVAL